MEVRKEIIRSGKHTYLDEYGRPAIHDTTPERIKHYFDSGTAMIAEGIPIPVPLEHDAKVSAANAADVAADRLRNNGGEVKRYETDIIKAKDGSDIHRLMSVLDIKDPGIAAKVENGSVRWVSPWINTFTDGKGKTWNEVISHVALTSRPRIHEQTPFESISMALSIAKPQKALPLTAGFALPNAGRLRKNGKPSFPIAFSMFTGVKLSSKELKDIDDDDDYVDEPESDEDSTPAEGDVPPGDPGAAAIKNENAADLDTDHSGDVSFEELIVHLLEMHDIHVPAGGAGKEFLQALVQGLLASAKEKVAKMPDENGNVLGTPGGGANPAPKGPITQESPPMMMSLDSISKIKDPEQKRLAEYCYSLQEKVGGIEKNSLASAQQQRQFRIEKLCKRLPAKARDQLLQQVASGNVALSMNHQTGTVIDPLNATLTLLESSVPDLPSLLTNEGKKLAVEMSHPQDGSAPMTDERAQELADSQFANDRTRQKVA